MLKMTKECTPPSNRESAMPFLDYLGRQVTPKFKVGDVVETSFSGKLTRHTITKVETGFVSQSGVMYRVSPAVTGNTWGDYFDQAWFDKVADALAFGYYS
jgi:hypothetical protein